MKYLPLTILLWVVSPEAFAQPAQPPQDGQFRMHGQVLQDEAKAWGAGQENPSEKQTFVPAPPEPPHRDLGAEALSSGRPLGQGFDQPNRR